MSRLERLALLAFFALVVAGLATQALLPTGIGAVAGLVVGVAVAARLNRLRTRLDAKLGADEAVTGFRPRRVVVRIALHLAVLGVLLVSTVLIPFIGDELFAAAGAAATAVPFVVTASRLRR